MFITQGLIVHTPQVEMKFPAGVCYVIKADHSYQHLIFISVKQA